MRRSSTRLALFDLDGTLIDSATGIFASLDHAFAQIGAELPPRETLHAWIGPPFHQTFPSVLGDDPERVELAIAKYREHYIDSGWAGHSVYPGIAEAIAALAATGCALGVVTTKVQDQARKIVDHLPFGAHFQRVYGPDLKTPHSAKAQMIAQALQDFAVPAANTAMIGDRHFDIEGARANDVRGIGVGWGFGSIRELEAAGADAIAHAPRELPALLGPA
ncbi:MAG: HAD hydrolase-like protein [Rudaea sp.]|nr:HAD hydrolase-like protein [Rudaea sp.]